MSDVPSRGNSSTSASGKWQDTGEPSPRGSGMTDDRGGGDADKSLLSRASDTLLDTAEKQKVAGANLMEDMAGAVRRAAGEFDSQVPQAAGYIRYAADQMDVMSDAVRRRDLGEIMSELQSFARRQPTAFLGATFLAGFAAVRFLKSSSNSTARPGAAMRAPNPVPGMARYGDLGGRSPEATSPSLES